MVGDGDRRYGVKRQLRRTGGYWRRPQDVSQMQRQFCCPTATQTCVGKAVVVMRNTVQSQRDILDRSFHNQRVSTLTKPAVIVSQSGAPMRYAQMRDTTHVRERALFIVPRIPSELELQARWFAGDFGRKFVGTSGDQIDVVQFGVWNREAGPDFRDAAIRINAGEPIHGCIEIDLLDRSWESHGHATNPAFEATVVHVFVERSDRTFFTRTLSNRNVVQICIDPKSLAG